MAKTQMKTDTADQTPAGEALDPNTINLSGDGVGALAQAVRALKTTEERVLHSLVLLTVEPMLEHPNARLFRCRSANPNGRPTRILPETWPVLRRAAAAFKTTPEQIASLVLQWHHAWLRSARLGNMLDHSPWFTQKP